MKHINYGMIGCGMMGQEHIRNIALLDNADVIAIFEPDPSMREAAKALVPNAKFVDSLEALLAEESVNALLIVSPNHLHVQQVQHIAKRRPLPMLLEKPVLTNAAEIAILKEIVNTYPEPIWVAMEYRYMPAVSAFIEQFEAETGGLTMLNITEHRFPFLEKVGDWNRFNRNSGGTFVEKCCHFFDLMRHMMKSDPLYVMAIGGQAHNHIDEVYEGQVSDIWDHGFVIIEFENGKRASLELSMFAEGSPYQETITGIGPKGKLSALIPGPTRFWSEAKGSAPIAQLQSYPRAKEAATKIEHIVVPAELLKAGDHNGSTFYQHQKFLNVLRNKDEVEVSLNDGIWAAAIGLAAQKSVQEKRAVYLHELL